jgi:hypothetical protein
MELVTLRDRRTDAAHVINRSLGLTTDDTDGFASRRSRAVASTTSHLSAAMDGLPGASLLPGPSGATAPAGADRGPRGPGRFLRSVFTRECASTCVFTFGGRVITHVLPEFSLAPLPLPSTCVFTFVFLAALLWFDVGTVWNPAGVVGSLCKARDARLDAFVQSSGGPLRHALGRGAACCAGGVLGCCAFAQLVAPVDCHLPDWAAAADAGAIAAAADAGASEPARAALRPSVAAAAAHECALTFGLFMFIYITRELGAAVSALLTAWYASIGVNAVGWLTGHAVCINPAQALGLVGSVRGLAAMAEPNMLLAYVAAPLLGGAAAGWCAKAMEANRMFVWRGFQRRAEGDRDW